MARYWSRNCVPWRQSWCSTSVHIGRQLGLRPRIPSDCLPAWQVRCITRARVPMPDCANVPLPVLLGLRLYARLHLLFVSTSNFT